MKRADWRALQGELDADGGLGGYRWGLERKRSLIDLERGVRTAGA